MSGRSLCEIASGIHTAGDKARDKDNNFYIVIKWIPYVQGRRGAVAPPAESTVPPPATFDRVISTTAYKTVC